MRNLAVITSFCLLLIMGCANNKQIVNSATTKSLNGTWELNYISGPRIAFEGLYPDKKPQLIFNVDSNTLFGTTSCNRLSRKLAVNGNKIDFNGPIATTKMFCPGEGEQVFLNTLKKVNTYSISDDNTLTLIMGDIAMMRFTKK